MAQSGDVLIGSIDELQSCRRRKVKVSDRDVLVVYHQGKVFALDLHCFHKGGSLFGGDIEDAGGHDCIKCPEHKQLIELSTGNRYRQKYKDGEMCGWIHEERKQRTHTAYTRDGHVYITPNLARNPPYASDQYNPPEQ